MPAIKWIFLLAAAGLIPLNHVEGEGAISPMQSASSTAEAYRQEAVEINTLAGNIHSLEDSRKLVKRVTNAFAKELPPQWPVQELQERVAVAEFEAATDPAKAIPEQRIVDAWNKYARAIGAPEESLVNKEEIHALRDGLFVTSKTFWSHGPQNIWTMPNIYLTTSEGKMAENCRALETLDIVWNLAAQPESLESARQQVKKGVLFSDSFKHQGNVRTEPHAEVIVRNGKQNPIEAAQMRYIGEHGVFAMMQLLDAFVNDLFPIR